MKKKLYFFDQNWKKLMEEYSFSEYEEKWVFPKLYPISFVLEYINFRISGGGDVNGAATA